MVGAVALLIFVFFRGIDTDHGYDNADNSKYNTYNVHDKCSPHYVLKAPFLRNIIKITPFEDDLG